LPFFLLFFFLFFASWDFRFARFMLLLWLLFGSFVSALHLFLLLVLNLPSPVCAGIGQSLFTAKTKAAIQLLLPEVNGDVTQISSWADDMKTTYYWSRDYHFLNTPDGCGGPGNPTCTYDRARDCHGSTLKKYPMACLDGALVNYTRQLVTRTLNGAPIDDFRMQEALKFVVHLMGDIHQPLHCGWEGDSGGNAYTGVFINNNNANLHSVWDSDILARRDNDFKGQTGYMKALSAAVNGSAGSWYTSRLASWMVCSSTAATPVMPGICFDDWGKDALYLAATYAYYDTKVSVR
jgi:hypothetical protein